MEPSSSPQAPPSSLLHEDMVISPRDTKPTGESKSHTKGWAVVAIVVGTLILGIGALGGIGLLHTHGLMSLPQWLASAVGTVGATPYNMSLWAIAGGGGLLGGGLTIAGIAKLVKTPQDNRFELSDIESDNE